MRTAPARQTNAFENLVDRVAAGNALQKKALASYLKTRDELFLVRANDFAQRLERYLNAIDLNLDFAASAYLELCRDMLIETAHFRRSGTYSCRCQRDALQDVYSDEAVMRSYMVGLAVSQYLWQNHYLILSYFLDVVRAKKSSVCNYLEIGPGHGVYLASAVHTFDRADFQAVDISPVSIQLCREFVPFLLDGDHFNLKLELQDVFAMQTNNRFSFITMGEVIEHLDDPRPILRKISSILTDDGIAFLTTCANCPAKDHVFLFRNVDEIRKLIESCGLRIESELALRLDDRSPPDALDLVNYAAVVSSNP